ncbi:MAG: prepilin peptidase [Candidatus Omnitrophica bacterium]|nr:prepilin peptidase [Candidatus Omnitrophota bacterium]
MILEQNFISIVFFVFGSIIGSFLNVCIIRMAKEESIVTPGSHCLKCNKMIPWYNNIPLLSYVMLRGKCRFCGEKFSFRYFLIELLTALSFLGLYRYFGFQPILWPYLVMVSGFIVATFTDIDERIIPDEISVGGMVVGLIFSLAIPQLHHADSHLLSLWRSVLGVLIGGGSIYLMGIIGDFLFKKESMGGGDVKLMAMIGAFLGWKLALLGFLIAPFFGAVFGIIEKIRTKESLIPYGPFLVIGALIALFFSEPLLAWIMSGYGLY